MNTTALRKLLEDVPKEDLKDQSGKLEEINKTHNHSVTTVSCDNLFCDWGTYNCFEYALGLTNSDSYVGVKKMGVFANSQFVTHLLDNEILSESDNNAELVLFSDENNKLKHAGKVINNRVQSKWGDALIFDHELLEAPLSYGDDCKYYCHIDEDIMLEHFYAYAETQGIKFNYE